MENSFVQQVRELTHLRCILIGKSLRKISDLTGISHRQYYKLLASSLSNQLGRNISKATVRRYTSRGVSQNLAYSDLAAAIEQAYQTYLDDPQRTAAERDHTQKAHDEFYSQYHNAMESLYNSFSKLAENSPLWDEFRMFAVADMFYNKQFFKEETPPSNEQIDFLVKSVIRYPYKRVQRIKNE